MFDFDNSTGALSFQLTKTNITYPYGVAFSSNNTLLYVSSKEGIHQYDLTSGSTTTILNSEFIFADITVNPTALQLAPDNKIYNAHYQSSIISSINAPNLLGALCDYEENAVQLIEGTSSRFGLPTFFSSIFNYSFFIFSTNLCFGDSTLFSVNTTPDSLLWNFGDPASGAETTTDLFTPAYQFSSPGLYSVAVTIYFGDSIINQEVALTITAPNALAINLGNDTTLCNGDSLVLNATNINATYLWQDSSTSDTLSLSEEGLYWVEVSQGECTVTDSVFIDTINLQLDLGKDIILCYGEQVFLNSNIDSVTYLWQDSSTYSSILASNEALYWLEVSRSICSAKDSIYVFIEPLVSATISRGDTTCRGMPFSDALITTTGFGPFSIEYTNNHNEFSFLGEEASYNISIGDSGTYTLLNIIGSRNCVGTVSGSATFVTLQTPYAEFAVGDREVYQDFDKVVLKNNSIGQIWSEWSFGDDFFLEDNSSIIHHTYGDFDTYTIELLIENDLACRDSLSQYFVVQSDEYFVPNAFTPNDRNNINDTFGLYNIRAENFEMKIFDKWGKTVYATNDIESPWDGTIDGTLAQPGSYNYRISLLDPLGSTRKLTGSVLLIK